VTTQEALDAFNELRDRATAAGVPMDKDTISVIPMASLNEAIRFAVTSGSQDGA
jgi:CRISPR-associated protein Csb1